MSLTELHEAMLADLDDSWQKTPGFPAWTAAPRASARPSCFHAWGLKAAQTAP